MIASNRVGEIAFFRLTVADLPFLIEVRNECRNFLHDNREFSLDQCRDWFVSTNPEFWLIKLDDAKIGYFRTSAYPGLHECRMVGADIHPDYRDRGLGKQCWKLFLHKIFAEQTKVARLEVLETNPRALRLYVSLGFRELPEERRFIERDGAQIASIVMCLKKEDFS